MSWLSDIFETKTEGRGWGAIPQSELQKRMEKFLEDLATMAQEFEARKIAPLTEAERGAVGIAEKTVAEGSPGMTEAIDTIRKIMYGPIEELPGLEGALQRIGEVGARALGSKKRSLAATGNLPSESSKGRDVYGRLMTDVEKEMITAAYPFYAQGMEAKLNAPVTLANLGVQDVATRTGVGTTTGALPRTIEQSILDAIFEATRTTQTWPYGAPAGIASNLLNKQAYAFDPGISSPSFFSQIAQPLATLGGAYMMRGGGGGGGIQPFTPSQQSMYNRMMTGY